MTTSASSVFPEAMHLYVISDDGLNLRSRTIPIFVSIQAYSCAPSVHLTEREDQMIVPAEVRKCVVFIGYKKHSGEMAMAGTGFFLGQIASQNFFLVTARHVIDGIRSLGLDEVYIRANLVAGESRWIGTPMAGWLFHPSDASVDVAVLQTLPSKELDHKILSTNMCSTDETLKKNEVDVGDEVFVVGLFKHHHGTSKNIPIVRVGNLAAIADEKVVTKKFGPIDAHLIEARSIGGLSGSPVFLNLGIARILGGVMQHAKGGANHLLFGLIHGHYDVSDSEIDCDLVVDSAGNQAHINTGIAIVVPIEKIIETINAHSVPVVA